MTKDDDVVGRVKADLAETCPHGSRSVYALIRKRDVESLLSRLTQAEGEVEKANSALKGIADDYMTSENHHPGYVLIPTQKFEQLVALASASEPLTVPEGNSSRDLAPDTCRGDGQEAATEPLKMLITQEWVERHTAGDDPDLACEAGAGFMEREGWWPIPSESALHQVLYGIPRPARTADGPDREALAAAIYEGAFSELWGRLPWSAIQNEAAKAPVYAAADRVLALLPTSSEPDDGAERVHDRSVHAEPISPLTHPETAVNGDGWQPITEPPEEGAWVFLWWPTMPIAFAPAVVGFNMFDGCGWELPAWRDYGEVFPTHWCPTTVLPPPPTSADASLAVVGEGGKEEGSSS